MTAVQTFIYAILALTSFGFCMWFFVRALINVFFENDAQGFMENMLRALLCCALVLIYEHEIPKP